MLLIPCPFCGPRDESEFVYGGRVIRFPAMDASAGNEELHEELREEWHQVVHMRTNSRGINAEFWYHHAGCECWIEVDREATTHSITGSRPAKKMEGLPT